MYEYRQILNRMRLGDTDLSIARTGLAGRSKAGEPRQIAQLAGWLDPATPLPDDATLAEHLDRRSLPASSVSLATSKNPDIKMQYERLLANGKSKMCAIGAAMRKLVHICYGVLKHQQPYTVQTVIE